MHLDCRPIGRFAHPYVKVFALARFEEQNVVAVVELCEFVELVEFSFRVQFGVFAAVREEGIEVIQEMPVPAKIILELLCSSNWFKLGRTDMLLLSNSE